MSGTNIKIEINQQYWCVHRTLMKPLLGTIIALTNSPGKMIGIQFDVNINGHSCDGRGVDGHCLWVTSQIIYNQFEWDNIANSINIQIDDVFQEMNNCKNVTKNGDMIFSEYE